MRTNHQDSRALGTGETAGQRQTRWRLYVVVGVAVAVLAMLAGVIWSATHPNLGATVRAQVTPTATTTSAPRVVYTSDWSHGADGWTLPATAKIVDGHLVLDGSAPVLVSIPYVPTTHNYMIEMDFSILTAQIGGHFGLTAFNAAGDRQYLAQMQCTPMHQGAWNPAMGGCAGAILVAARGGTYPSGVFTSDYVIHSGPQSFQVNVTGDTVNFCPGDDCLVPVMSAVPMDASPRLMIEERGVRLLVARVTVTALSLGERH